MDRLHRAIKNVHRLDDLAARGTALTRLPPLPKLLAVLVYLCVTLSFQKYALTGLLGMALWPILLYEIDDLSIVKTLRQCWAVVALLVLVGIANLFFDRAPVLTPTAASTMAAPIKPAAEAPAALSDPVKL